VQQKKFETSRIAPCLFRDAAFAEPFKVVEGHIHIRDVPGNGLEWDEEAIARYEFEV
jgi:L-alanine-DL-glutamate epimerase-like enolase superfamily enzyme